MNDSVLTKGVYHLPNQSTQGGLYDTNSTREFWCTQIKNDNDHVSLEAYRPQGRENVPDNKANTVKIRGNKWRKK